MGNIMKKPSREGAEARAPLLDAEASVPDPLVAEGVERAEARAPHLDAAARVEVGAEVVPEALAHDGAYALALRERRLLQDAAARLYREHLRNDAEAERRRRRVMNADELEELRAAWRAAADAAFERPVAWQQLRTRSSRRGSSMRG